MIPMASRDFPRMSWLPVGILILQGILEAQNAIVIDGDFGDWEHIPVIVSDPPDDAHDTDWFSDGLSQPIPLSYRDVDILEVKFANDADNLYGYMRATGQIGRTSSASAGHSRRGRYYFIFTIDVDDDIATGYRLAEGNYWPDSKGYDVNMEVEFYDGAFNTGHYINHEFMSESELEQGRVDLAMGIMRLAPGTYDYYLQWVTFDNCTYVEVTDRGPVYQGIIDVALSPDGHEAEIRAPLWGFLQDADRRRIVDIGKTVVVSASLEGSGELSEEAIAGGNPPGSTAIWGSDTAEPFRYTIVNPEGGNGMADCNRNRMPDACDLLHGTSQDANNDGLPDDCQKPFHRGDPDGNGASNLGDAVFLLQYLFQDGGSPACLDSGDANNDGSVDVSDAVHLLRFIFGGKAPPAPPGPPGSPCGQDPEAIYSPGNLGCQEYTNC
jgi:hypothetical protein